MEGHWGATASCGGGEGAGPGRGSKPGWSGWAPALQAADFSERGTVTASLCGLPHGYHHCHVPRRQHGQLQPHARGETAPQTGRQPKQRPEGRHDLFIVPWCQEFGGHHTAGTGKRLTEGETEALRVAEPASGPCLSGGDPGQALPSSGLTFPDQRGRAEDKPGATHTLGPTRALGPNLESRPCPEPFSLALDARGNRELTS